MSNKKKSGKKDTSSDELKSIKSKLLSRGASLLSVGLKTTAKAAGLAINTALSPKEKKEEIYKEFLLDSVTALTNEMEKLKGGIMKAGQMLSIYGEHFFPKEINDVLKKLQSQSKPVSFEEMEKAIIRSLGKERYSKIKVDPVAIGSASMGQVYKVEIEGQARVLKVQYPGVAKSIDSDLKAIRTVLSFTKLIPDQKKFEGIFTEVKEMLHREADYGLELKSLVKHGELVGEIPGLTLPTPYPEYSTKKVLCMDYIEGRRFDDPAVTGLSIERRNRLGVSLIHLLFKEIFEWRSVQTDPHIGNFLVQIKEDGYEEDKIVLLDFGAMRKLPKSYITPFNLMALSAVNGDPDGILKGAEDLNFIREDDSQKMKDLFVKIILKATEPFQEKYEGDSIDGLKVSEKDYDWGENKVVDELSAMAKDAIFSFKLRPPPREAVFVDRKLVGTAMILKTLGVKYGPRKLALKYLDPK